MLISAGDLIKKSFALYKANFGLFIKYVLVSYVPGVILAIAGLVLGGAAGLLFMNDNGGVAVGALIILGLVVLAAIIASIWIFIAFIRVIASRYLDKAPEGVGAELKKAIPLILPYIGASIMFGLIMVGGFILFIVPAIIFSIWFAFYMYEIALDNRSVMDSLKGSKSLVSGRWWGILWRFFAPAFIFGIITFIAQGVVQLPLELVGNTAESTGLFMTATILSVLLTTAINVIMTPLTAASQVILYIEAKNTPVTAPPSSPTAPTGPAAPAPPEA